MLNKLRFKTLKVVCCLGILTLLWHCKSSDLANDQEHTAGITMLNTLMEQDAYNVDIEVVYPFATAATQRVVNSLLLPRTGNNASRVDVRGDGHFINVHKDSVKGNLSFFGERRLSGGPYGGRDGGIVFGDIPKDFEKAINEKKKKLEIKFTVSQNDEPSETYDVRLNIFPNKKVSVSITSTYKMIINYSGTLQPEIN